MADQLLWLETVLKGVIGLIMLALPVTAARLAGLPHANSAFWARLFGAALLGMAGAFALEGYGQFNTGLAGRGLGLGGAVVINTVALLSLIGTLIFGAVASRRGLLLFWLLSLILALLILFEIGYA